MLDLYDEVGQVATPSDALREFAENYGAMHPDKAWVLHDRDVWLANPYYSGPPCPHPEDDSAWDALETDQDYFNLFRNA